MLIIRRSNFIIQHLISSHPVGGRPVRRLTEDSRICALSLSIAKITMYCVCVCVCVFVCVCVCVLPSGFRCAFFCFSMQPFLSISYS